MSRPRVLALTAAAFLLAACGDGEALRPPCPAGKLCLEYGNTAEPLTLDPQKSSGVWESNIIGEMAVGLTEQDPAGNAVPGMATHWETSADGLTWTFHLRNAKWSDGVPVTADDFVFGLRREMDPKTAANQASQIYPIKNAQLVNAGKLPPTALGVRAIDAKTVEIRLEHPWPILLDYAYGPVMAPAPRHAVAKWGDDWVQPAHYVSNGPYKLVSWVLGDKVVIERNPLYYEADKICIDRISYYPTTDTVSAERRVKRGELDINTNVVSNRVARLRQPSQMPDYLRVTPYIGVTFLTFNVRDTPALKDRRVRHAFAMAIDREFIAGKLLRGGQTPAVTFVPPGMVDYDGRQKVYWAAWPLERRQAEARRLLAEAGYGPGHPLKLDLKHRNSADPVAFTPAIQADMKAVGIDLTLTMNETQIAYAAYDTKDYQVGDAGWVGANDAMGYLYLNRRDTGPQNWTGYANPRYDALLDAANLERDIGKRAELMAQADRMLLDDLPMAPLFYPATRELVNPDITGWVDNVFDGHKARFLCFKDAAARRAGNRR